MEPTEPEERAERSGPAPAPARRSSVLGRLRPAYVLAAVMVLVGVVLLSTAQPPGFTLRADQRPLSPIEISQANRCSPLRVLPADTTTVRLVRAPGGSAPSRIRVEAPGGYSVTTGAPRPNGRDLDYPLPQAITEDRLGASACLLRDRGQPRPTVLGESAPTIALVGERPASWLSAIPRLSERAAFGRGTFLGAAALPIGFLLVCGACGLLVFLGARHLGSDALIDRRTVVLLGVAGALWGGAYAVTTPPFQAPDEMVHLRYAELIVDRQAIPQTSESRADGYSPQLQAALGQTLVGSVAFAPNRRQPWSALEDRALDANLKTLPAGQSRDTHDNASSQPPTYYGIVAAAQAVAGGSILDRLLVSRLVSALLFGLGIAGLAVFAREAVPRAGGLVVAGVAVFAALPLTGFIAGSVNPDALMMVASAWAFAVTAMIVRRGLTWRRALALGGLIGLGIMSKLTFAGLVPMFLVLGLVVLVRSARGKTLRHELPMLAGSVAVAAAVAAPYLLWAILSGRGLVFGPADPNAAPAAAFSLRESLTYWFGLYIGEVGPIQRRLELSGPIDLWGDGLVGRLGWLDYGFPRTAVLRILNVWELLAAGALFGIVRAIRARRAIPVDVIIYAVGVFGVSLLVARAGLTSRQAGNTGFEQARYLFPFAAVGVAGVALALRQLPRRRWAEWAAAAVLVGALTHGVAGYLITIGRYFA